MYMLRLSIDVGSGGSVLRRRTRFNGVNWTVVLLIGGHQLISRRGVYLK